MVSKRSEYGREYRPSSLVKNIPTYYESLTYRNRRRELEYAHTPISWDFDDLDKKDDSSPSEEKDIEEQIPVENLKIVEEDGDEENKEEEEEDSSEEDEDEKDLKESDAKVKCSSTKANGFDDVLIEKQTPETRQLTKLAKEKLNKYASSENKDNPEQIKLSLKTENSKGDVLKPKKVDDKTFVQRSKPKRPDRAVKIPPRPKSGSLPSRAKSATSRPKSAVTRPQSVVQSSSSERPPFMLYASGNSERSVGTKRTHNVHCSTEIYPAAVKALQQHQIRMKKWEEQRRKASARDKKRKNVFAEKLAKDTTAWQSEYRRMYPVYGNDEYSRRLKAVDLARSRKVKCDL